MKLLRMWAVPGPRACNHVFIMRCIIKIPLPLINLTILHVLYRLQYRSETNSGSYLWMRCSRLRLNADYGSGGSGTSGSHT